MRPGFFDQEDRLAKLEKQFDRARVEQVFGNQRTLQGKSLGSDHGQGWGSGQGRADEPDL
jgi:hypothetical protein